MEIFIPKTIEEYEPELRLVFDLMVTKLNMNRHKGFGESSNILGLLNGLRDETDEMREAIDNENQMAVVMEAVDVSNFGALIAIMMLRLTKADFKVLQQSHHVGKTTI